jgi:hypothetical protein
LGTFLAILIIVAIVVGVLLLQRAKRAAVSATVKVVNRKLLYKPEYEQGLQIVSAPIRLTIPASVSDVMREVTAHVTTDSLPLGLKAVVYESSRAAGRITYAFGNKLVPRSFEVELLFASRGATTDVAFTVLKWREKDGLVLGRETLERLRTEVLAGFTAAGADAMIADGLAVGHRPVPAFFTDQTGLKKYGFAAVGGALVVIAAVKFSIIGYYPSEVPLYLGMMIAGGVCLYLSSKTKIRKVDDVAAGGAAFPVSSTTPMSAPKANVRAPLAGGSQPSAAQNSGEKAGYCTACGSPLRSALAFCTSCGAKVVRQTGPSVASPGG